MQDHMKQNVREKIEVKRTNWKYIRLMAGGLCSLIGILIAIYVGGWLLILQPLKTAFMAYAAGVLTRRIIVTTAIKCACSLTVSGAIWCCGYIVKQKFIGYEEA